MSSYLSWNQYHFESFKFTGSLHMMLYLFGSELIRLGLTQEIGSAREEGRILLPGPGIGPILENDYTKVTDFHEEVLIYMFQ